MKLTFFLLVREGNQAPNQMNQCDLLLCFFEKYFNVFSWLNEKSICDQFATYTMLGKKQKYTRLLIALVFQVLGSGWLTQHSLTCFEFWRIMVGSLGTSICWLGRVHCKIQCLHRHANNSAICVICVIQYQQILKSNSNLKFYFFLKKIKFVMTLRVKQRKM